MAVSKDTDEKSVGVLLKVVEFDSPAFQAEVESLKIPLRGRSLTAAIAFVTGTGFTLFGCVCCSLWKMEHADFLESVYKI